jgi:hypothetical protein
MFHGERGHDISREEAKKMGDSPSFRFDAESLDALENKDPDHRLETVFAEIGSIIDGAELEDAEKEKMRELLFEVKVDCLSYVECVLEHTIASETPLEFRARTGYKDNTEALDHRRRQAHIRYVDSLNILFRNLLKRGVETVRPYAERFAGDPRSPDHRRKVANAAMAYAWRKAKESLETED